MHIRFLAAFIASTLVILSSSIAHAHEAYYRDVESTECATPRLLEQIKAKFRSQAFKIHDRPDWRINDITNIHQHRYDPQDVHAARPIGRRYCHATVHLSDHSSREMWFLIESGVGFAGFGGTFFGALPPVQKAFGNGNRIHNVEFCIAGLDPMNAYNSDCRTLR